jgi:hypothetical protein
MEAWILFLTTKYLTYIFIAVSFGFAFFYRHQLLACIHCKPVLLILSNYLQLASNRPRHKFGVFTFIDSSRTHLKEHKKSLKDIFLDVSKLLRFLTSIELYTKVSI